MLMIMGEDNPRGIYSINMGSGFRSDVLDPVRAHIMKDRPGIDEAPDQPGTGDTINFRILPGDRVTIEVSPYDPSRGRITFRHRN